MNKRFVLLGALISLSAVAGEQADIAPAFVCTNPAHKNIKFKQLAYHALVQSQCAQKIELVRVLATEEAEHTKIKNKKIGMYADFQPQHEQRLAQLKQISLKALKRIAFLEQENKQFRTHVCQRQNMLASESGNALRLRISQHLGREESSGKVNGTPAESDFQDKESSFMCPHSRHEEIFLKTMAYRHDAQTCKGTIEKLRSQITRVRNAQLHAQKELVDSYCQHSPHDSSYVLEKFVLETLIIRKKMLELTELNAHYKHRLKEIYQS